MKVPRIKRHPKTWEEVLRPYASRLSLAYKIEASVSFNPSGCKSLYDLFTIMGNRLEYTARLERAVIQAQDKKGLLEAKNLVYRERERVDNLL